MIRMTRWSVSIQSSLTPPYGTLLGPEAGACGLGGVTRQSFLPDGASFTFEVGSYFLEVKATTTRDVRLTPKQANKAWQEPDRFVLCVVDLYGQQIKEAWEPADIVPWARIVTKIGGAFEEIHKGVTRFSDTAKPVHLRNEEMLRYGVSLDLWSQGVAIDESVRSLSRP